MEKGLRVKHGGTEGWGRWWRDGGRAEEIKGAGVEGGVKGGMSITRDGRMRTGMEGEMGEDRAKQKDSWRNGMVTPRCSMEDGACACRPHLMGRQCDQVQPGFFCAPLDYYTYEGEQATGHGHDHPQLPVSLLWGSLLPQPGLVHDCYHALCSMHGCHHAPCMTVTL